MKKQNYRIMFVLAIFVGVVVGLIIASNFDLAEHGVAASSSGSEPALALGSSEPASPQLLELENLSKAFVQVAKEVSPAVVTINSQATIRSQNPLFPFFDDETFRRYFRVPEQQEQVRRGLGSGVIVNSDGYILTNNHVVSEADEVTVVFENEEYDAEIVGTDPESDLAVVKIDKKGLPIIKLGDSEKLEVGEWVLAIGNPFSDILQHTVTSGIVSAKGRNLPIGDGRRIQYQDFIQTDAAINPGNSGGALVNLRGELVGINTAILGQANVGIGFAIPVNLARNVMEQLIADGRVVRGYLGVLIESVDDDMAQAFEMEKAGGALVQRVVNDSPAQKAGIEPGDIILEVEGTEITDSNHLTNLIAGYEPGTKVDMTIWREGKKKEISVKLTERPTGGDELSVEPAQKDVTEKLGLEVQDLSSQLARRFGYEAEEGVLITNVRRSSIASREGLRPGDLVLSVARQPVTNVREFYKIVENAKPNQILLFRLKRDDVSFFRTLRVPKDKDDE
ncbi:DegQ family serine endoprotease [candidate division KSB1 bacterium]|nr:DegQ family serine endoprotease [candidate division KSB1 bacterium]